MGASPIPTDIIIYMVEVLVAQDHNVFVIDINAEAVGL